MRWERARAYLAAWSVLAALALVVLSIATAVAYLSVYSDFGTLP